MTERITVRQVDPWAEYKRTHCGCKDASSYNSCQGLPTCTLRADHPERKAPPTVEYRRPSRTYEWSMLIVAMAAATVGFIAGVLLK